MKMRPERTEGLSGIFGSIVIAEKRQVSIMLLSLQILGLIISWIAYLFRPALLYVWFTKLVSRSSRMAAQNMTGADFPEATILENYWKTIRDETQTFLSELDKDGLPKSGHSSARSAVIPIKSYRVWEGIATSWFRDTMQLLEMIPMITTARLVMIGQEHGRVHSVRMFKGLLSYYLPLATPKAGTGFIASDGICHRLEEGHGLLVDETDAHIIYHGSTDPLILLSLDVQRFSSLPSWARWINHILVRLINSSTRVQEAVRKVEHALARHHPTIHGLVIQPSITTLQS